MAKVIIHNGLEHQHLDHSHLGNDNTNFQVDRQKTEEFRKRLMKEYEQGWGKSPFNQLMRDREKGIHPTAYDK